MPETENAPDQRERVARRIARAGICSRRQAETLIHKGRVAVNGEPLDHPAANVGPDDEVFVDGEPLPPLEPPRLWRFHKRPGRISTRRDPEGRRTIFDDLPPHLPRVMAVGRLDLNSEGLLLLTNDGRLARHLEHPDTGLVRRYRVRVHGRVDENALAALENGVTVEGVTYGPIKAGLERQQGSNAWLTVSLREGRNREVRRVLEHLGYSVTRLIRVAYGPFQLGKLPRDRVAEVRRPALRDQLGTKLWASLTAGLKEKA